MAGDNEEWHHLKGKMVELRIDGRLIRTAEVEEVTNDSSFLWLRFWGTDTRQLIAKYDGYSITPTASETD